MQQLILTGNVATASLRSYTAKERQLSKLKGSCNFFQKKNCRSSQQGSLSKRERLFLSAFRLATIIQKLAASFSTLKKEEADPEHYIAVVTAGTSDVPVAEEAAVTAETFGHSVRRIYDVGVAGIHRLFNRLEEIQKASVIIVIAGMEGALVSVVGGLVNVPVIAVPTSVGYGSNLQGLTTLMSMLTSCASGVTVVNIDNGFGAAYSACMINRLNHNRKEN